MPESKLSRRLSEFLGVALFALALIFTINNDLVSRALEGLAPADRGVMLTRRPVSVAESATVYALLGNGRRHAWGSTGSQRSWVAASRTVPTGPSIC